MGIIACFFFVFSGRSAFLPSSQPLHSCHQVGGHFSLPSAATQPGGAPVAQHLAPALKIAPQQSKRVEREKKKSSLFSKKEKLAQMVMEYAGACGWLSLAVFIFLVSKHRCGGKIEFIRCYKYSGYISGTDTWLELGCILPGFHSQHLNNQLENIGALAMFYWRPRKWFYEL